MGLRRLPQRPVASGGRGPVFQLAGEGAGVGHGAYRRAVKVGYRDHHHVL